ncbi:MAG: UbiA prenyltransferase family protein [Acidimicrobiales bacterium]
MHISDHGPEDLASAFYATPRLVHNKRAREWWTLLHPPYSLCHLSFVVVGACLAGPVSESRLATTLVAFLLAVGIGAHALDELHDRPLGTTIPTWQLVTASIVGLAGACGLGVFGVFYVNGALIYFIVVGVFIALGYNLELFHGWLHNDLTFALGWGAFPVLTSYFAQHASLDAPAIGAALYASFIALAQRQLSTPARLIRRSTTAVEGTLTHLDGHTSALTRRGLLVPLERALSFLCWASVFLALALWYTRLNLPY